MNTKNYFKDQTLTPNDLCFIHQFQNTTIESQKLRWQTNKPAEYHTQKTTFIRHQNKKLFTPQDQDPIPLLLDFIKYPNSISIQVIPYHHIPQTNITYYQLCLSEHETNNITSIWLSHLLIQSNGIHIPIKNWQKNQEFQTANTPEGLFYQAETLATHYYHEDPSEEKDPPYINELTQIAKAYSVPEDIIIAAQNTYNELQNTHYFNQQNPQKTPTQNHIEHYIFHNNTMFTEIYYQEGIQPAIQEITKTTDPFILYTFDPKKQTGAQLICNTNFLPHYTQLEPQDYQTLHQELKNHPQNQSIQ